MSIELIPVKSSRIESIGYDSDTALLSIKFLNGEVHNYHHVPPKEYSALMEADSKGGYFDSNIAPEYRSVTKSCCGGPRNR